VIRATGNGARGLRLLRLDPRYHPGTGLDTDPACTSYAGWAKRGVLWWNAQEVLKQEIDPAAGDLAAVAAPMACCMPRSAGRRTMPQVLLQLAGRRPAVRNAPAK